MPELPEVETTVTGIKACLTKHTIKKVIVRNPNLRWPINADLANILPGKIAQSVVRRGKYILVNFKLGTLIIHLGMSGKLCVTDKIEPPLKHDHVDIFLGKYLIRYNDPRRFGCMLWTTTSPFEHQLIKNLGVEPLTTAFNAKYLLTKAQNKKTTIKQFLMNHNIVVGIGNIYACEILFKAKIHPISSAAKLDLQQYQAIVKYAKQILKLAITQGGTTLKDFKHGENQLGYFAQKLAVYGKDGQKCTKCNNPVKSIVLGQRSTFFCDSCQTVFA